MSSGSSTCGFRSRTGGAEAHVDEFRAAHQLAEDDRGPVEDRRQGRAARPFRASANISGRTSTSERIGQKPETTLPGSNSISAAPACAISSEASMRQAAEARRGGRARRPQLFLGLAGACFHVATQSGATVEKSRSGWRFRSDVFEERSELGAREHRRKRRDTKTRPRRAFQAGGDPRRPMERLIPGAYKVGGRRIAKPTGRARDSSLRISKAPGISYSCREAQNAETQYSPARAAAPVGCRTCAQPARSLVSRTKKLPREIRACVSKERRPMSPTRI